MDNAKLCESYFLFGRDSHEFILKKTMCWEKIDRVAYTFNAM